MDGAERSIMVSGGIFFSNGLTVFNNTLYWTQVTPTAVLAIEPEGDQPRRVIYEDTTLRKQLNDIKAVHPLRQLLPPGKMRYILPAYLYSIVPFNQWLYIVCLPTAPLPRGSIS